MYFTVMYYVNNNHLTHSQLCWSFITDMPAFLANRTLNSEIDISPIAHLPRSTLKLTWHSANVQELVTALRLLMASATRGQANIQPLPGPHTQVCKGTICPPDRFARWENLPGGQFPGHVCASLDLDFLHRAHSCPNQSNLFKIIATYTIDLNT